jgi:tetratricopeptide (TPR) repeat protein
MRQLSLFVSSPSDVQAERQIAESVITRINRQFDGRLRIEPLFWEYEPMSFGEGFQPQIPSTADYDLVLCILWSRLGTPLTAPDGKHYESGTEYEVETALASWRKHKRPEVWIYFNQGQPPLKHWPIEDFNRSVREIEGVVNFVKKHAINPATGEHQNAFTSYADLGRFEIILEEHLRRWALRQASAPAAEEPARSEVVATWTEGSPFRGLEVFEFEHAEIFFGRTKAIGQVIDRLKQQAFNWESDRQRRGAVCALNSPRPREKRSSTEWPAPDPAIFVLVSAMSGVGKSSLLRAGVLPLLVRPGVIEGVGSWRRAVFRPTQYTGDLFDGLAQALTETEALPELIAGQATVESLAADLRRSPNAADLLVRQALGHAADVERVKKEAECTLTIDRYRFEGRLDEVNARERQRTAIVPKPIRLVLLIDQLEEIFTSPLLAEAPCSAKEFLTAIATLARSGEVWVLSSLRSDFFSRCTEFPELMALKSGDGHYDLEAPTKDEIGHIIRQPALAAGLRFERSARDGIVTSLDETLRDSALNNPAALPLLEYCLDELYKTAQDGALTYQAFEELGGIDGALRQRAEATFLGLPDWQQEAFKQIMARITTVTDDRAGTFSRRWADVEELRRIPGASGFLDAFLAKETRLFVAARGVQDRATVSVAHEALLTAWPRLRDWLLSDRELLLVRAQLGAVATEWAKAAEKDKNGYLLPRGLQLEKTRQAQAGGYLGGNESRFVDASVQAIDAQRRKEERRRRNLLIAVSAGCAIALVLAGVSYRQYRAASRARDREKAALAISRESERAANEARGSADNLINYMLVDLRVKLQPIGRLDLLENLGQQVSSYLDRLPEKTLTPDRLRQKGLLLLNLGDVLVSQGKSDQALQNYQQSLQIAQRLTDKDPSNTAWQGVLVVSYEKIGDVLSNQGKLDQAFQSYQQELQIYQLLADKDPSNIESLSGLAGTYERIGDVFSNQGKLDQALQKYQQGLQITQRLADKDPSNVVWQHDLEASDVRIGDVFFLQGTLDRALQNYQQALQISQLLTDKDPSNTNWQGDRVASNERIGHLLFCQGKLDQALQDYQQELQIAQLLTDKDPSNVGWQRALALSYSEVGDVLFCQGKSDQALQNYQQGLQITQRLADKDPSNTDWQCDRVASYERIGDALFNQGKLDQAHQDYQQGLQISQLLTEKDPSNTAWQRELAVLFDKVGTVLFLQSKLDQALQNYQQGLQIIKLLTDKDPSNTVWQTDLAVLYTKVGDVLSSQGKLDQAFRNYQESFQITQRLADKDSSNTDLQYNLAVSYAKVGDVLSAQGKFDQALQNYQQGLQIIKRLADKDPSHTDWQRLLILVLGKTSVSYRSTKPNETGTGEAKKLLEQTVALLGSYSGPGRKELLEWIEKIK